MPLSVIIAEPSYLMKRGISALINDMLRTEIVFIDDSQELNHYIDTNVVQAVIINEQILDEMQNPELFFQLKEDTRYIALSDNPDGFREKRKFDAVLNRNSQKEDIVPVIESLLMPET